MNTTLGIKNFRIFDDKGAVVNLRPLTILTGCNSSGKSSIVKSLILLNEFLLGVRTMNPNEEPRLEFNKKPLSLLGNFDSILNKEAMTNGNNAITLSYTLDSLFWGERASVEMTFAAQNSDIRKEGFLKDITIKDNQGALIFYGKGIYALKRFFRDLKGGYLPIYSNQSPVAIEKTNSFKSLYFIYHIVYQVLDALNGAHTNSFIIGEGTKEEYDQVYKEALEVLNGLKSTTSKENILKAIDFYSKKHGDKCLHDLFTTDGVFVEKAMKAGILTYLPILDVLDTIEKIDFEAKFMEMCKTVASISSYYCELVKCVVAEFTEGDYQVFSEYYRHKENLTLKHISSLDNTVAVNADCALSDWEHYYYPIIHETINNEEWIGVDSSSKIDLKGKVSLPLLFDLLTSIKDRPNDKDYVSYSEIPSIVNSCDHKILRDYLNFKRYALQDLLSVDICNGLRYVGSNRIDIKRLYSFENQDNFGLTVSEYFEALRMNSFIAKKQPETLKEACASETKKEKPQAMSFMDHWIRKFGIGYRLRIEPLSDGVGLVLKIYQDENDSEGRILADYGYGVSQLVSILLEIETAIMKVETHYEGPNVVDYVKGTANLNRIFTASREVCTPITIAIEEPEIHLHPRYQSLLADMFVDAYENYGIHFILETHSEYLIRKLQNHVGKGTLKPDALSFLYVEDGNGNERKVREIGIAQDGRLTDKFGPGFFDEADSLAMNLLKIKGGLI